MKQETGFSPEAAVYERYAAGARQVEKALCCPVEYSPRYLEAIPAEVLERDYGCGDPTPFVRRGETVLDLGSGGGKLCFIAAQIVGPEGRVIGVDCNHEMLSLARRSAPLVAEKIGYQNVEFRFGMIQDLQLDLDLLNESLNKFPITSAAGLIELRQVEQRLRDQQPLVESGSVDCVLSNCVLNLVRIQDRRQLFSGIFRVLKKGGRAAISDIVSDVPVPAEMQNDPDLWSGCLSGAYQEKEFLEAFAEAGFHGIEIAKLSESPWQVVNGIEFRSMTVVASKGKQGPCLERNQAVIYRGPFSEVRDDDGHSFARGVRTAVCDKTFRLLQCHPYAGSFIPVEPATEIPLELAAPFDCSRSKVRHPHESKGRGTGMKVIMKSGDCAPGQCCQD